jgi:catalase
LKAGERGPTLLEDFIFRQKIQHFDHERVPERAVHARGAGKMLQLPSCMLVSRN